ncbi:uroporphyrinogen-III C-methyltransferase [Thermobrachium celere]|uniref:uroporphyrinogen-III C-methyltransferase n=1 Tax=Thermobrachium celere DSM 8682 TaxID=941824 RepID=R7RPJ9_9CLOT|nr:uroporphyrinogen-III C-methyltransferase [Thermobrachium celere]CDF57301.1 Uroporphyrinogen-III methyltransferase / Uroporphyrinogen-III synthase [Thermobrachium celere DSM 8682]
MGKVYLIGAGPGDEELLTLKAVNKIKEADVILYDNLINTNILSYAKDGAKLVFCGKRAGKHYKTQEEINDLIVEYAKKGLRVVRLKGGDPYIFGRGGEEVLRLFREDIDFEVVSGVTSAISALNYAGIPATYRGIAQSFHILTARSEKELKLDFSIISKLEGTLVFLMGFREIDMICKKLIENGKSKETPCAVIESGTTSRQRVCCGVLNDITDKIKEQNIGTPAIFVVGDVVRFRDKLNWYEKKPLFGKRVCITRPKKQMSELKNKILELGGEVLELPTIKIIKIEGALDRYIDKLDKYNFVIFTSVNGVDIFFDDLIEREIDIRTIKAKVYAIGEKTKEQLKRRGIVAACGDEYTQEGLFEKIRLEVKKGDKVLIPRAKGARDFLIDALKNIGVEVDEVCIYESGLEIERAHVDCDIYTFASPSTVKNFIKLYGKDVLKNKKIVAIGPITRDELRREGFSAEIPRKYTVDGIIETILGGYEDDL